MKFVFYQKTLIPINEKLVKNCKIYISNIQLNANLFCKLRILNLIN